ncbi:type II secretion system protein [Aquirhabdus sp.]|uniref:type II secretion system protein n=1 Tax=Aquirhabdus sp. TaxID=2824160 RepID=UPI00396C9FF4
MYRVRGFTMIELLVVLAVIAMLLSIVAPRYIHQADRAKEAALKENLSTLRVAIDQYYGDKGTYPERLEQLVQAHYLRKIPLDPVKNSDSAWSLVLQDEEGHKVIYDVKSTAIGKSLDGSVYSSW